MTFTLSLDQPRQICFDEAATDRFTEITGVSPKDLPAFGDGPVIRNFELLATLIWCTLGADDRQALPRETLFHRLTPKMISSFCAKASQELWQNKGSAE